MESGWNLGLLCSTLGTLWGVLFPIVQNGWSPIDESVCVSARTAIRGVRYDGFWWVSIEAVSQRDVSDLILRYAQRLKSLLESLREQQLVVCSGLTGTESSYIFNVSAGVPPDTCGAQNGYWCLSRWLQSWRRNTKV